MPLAKLLLLFSVVLLLGCGDEAVPVQPPTDAPSEQARTILQNMAQTGEVGSAAMELETQIQQIQATDPAKGEALLKDLEQLKAANNPAAVKAKANEMLGKL